MLDPVATEARYGARNYAPLPVTLTEGRGVWLHDVEGKRYLDMMSAYSAVSHGHSHPRLVAALTGQAERLAMTSRAFSTDRLGPFLAALCELAGFEAALPMNTGAEAVETAIKAARRWGYRRKGIEAGEAEILVASSNFHGRTTTIISFSSDPGSQGDFGPFTPGFVDVPFGDAAAMAAAVTPRTAAIIVEPIQGEAGIIVPPDGYLRDLRRIADENGILLILDEVQSGMGRTGRNFAFEHEDIRPDGLILGKALGGGLYPVSAFLADRAVMDIFDPGSHGSTFGGNPLAAAVGLEAIEVMREEDLPGRSAELGDYLMTRLRGLNAPAIEAVRGRGLWVGVDLDPAQITGRQAAEGLIARGVLAKETRKTTLRLAPPLVIEKNEIDVAVDALAETLSEL